MAEEKEIVIGDVEVRLDEPGGTAVDELVIGIGHGCQFHLERMRSNAVWVGAYPRDGQGQLIKGQRVVMWISSDTPITMEYEIEEC